MWSFSGPTPRPSRISMVMERDTTSRDARSLAVGAYLSRWGEEGRGKREAGREGDPPEMACAAVRWLGTCSSIGGAPSQPARPLKVHPHRQRPPYKMVPKTSGVRVQVRRGSTNQAIQCGCTITIHNDHRGQGRLSCKLQRNGGLVYPIVVGPDGIRVIVDAMGNVVANQRAPASQRGLQNIVIRSSSNCV